MVCKKEDLLTSLHKMAGCKYRFSLLCKDINELNGLRATRNRYESLMDQRDELCESPSFESCSIYQSLEKLMSGAKSYIKNVPKLNKLAKKILEENK